MSDHGRRVRDPDGRSVKSMSSRGKITNSGFVFVDFRLEGVRSADEVASNSYVVGWWIWMLDLRTTSSSRRIEI